LISDLVYVNYRIPLSAHLLSSAFSLHPPYIDQKMAQSPAMHTEPTTFSAEAYFASQPPPPTLQRDIERVREFVKRQEKEGRPVVLVTVR